MPRYTVAFEIAPALTVSVEVYAQNAEDAIHKAALYACQTDKTIRPGKVLEVIETAP
jgi:hypothetical protein